LNTEVALANAKQNLVKVKNTVRLTQASFNTVLARPVDAPVAEQDILAYSREMGDFEIKRVLPDPDAVIKNIPTTEKAVKQGEENLRASEERYKAQVKTITELFDARAQFIIARVNYYRALYDQPLAKARLLRGLGEY